MRYQIRDLAVDSFRLAEEKPGNQKSSALEVTHIWREDGTAKTHTERIAAGTNSHPYSIDIPASAKVLNQAIIFESK